MKHLQALHQEVVQAAVLVVLHPALLDIPIMIMNIINMYQVKIQIGSMKPIVHKHQE